MSRRVVAATKEYVIRSASTFNTFIVAAKIHSQGCPIYFSFRNNFLNIVELGTVFNMNDMLAARR